MNDDYLWNGSGEVDPEIARLEGLLAPYRYDRPFRAPAPARRRRAARWLAACAVLAIAVSALVAAAIFYRLQWEPARPWPIISVEGEATIDGRNATGAMSLSPGSVLRTGPGGRVSVRVARIGVLDVGPSSTLSLESTASERHLVRLDSGSVVARVWAPPISLTVLTPLGRASDLGCEFMLRYDNRGGSIHVTSGWVDFDGRERSSVIPEDATALLYPEGPGTPWYDDAAPEFIEAVRRYDVGAAGALDAVLQNARTRDVMTLLHMLERAPAGERERLFARAAALASPPAGVTLERIAVRDHDAMAAWRHSIGLTGIKRWWLNWEDALPRRAVSLTK